MRSRQPHLRIAAAPGAKSEGARSGIRDRAEGERLLQHQGLKGLRAALAQPYGEDASTGWQHFWRGYVLQFDDLAQARAEWLLAEARFQHEGDAVGLELAACGLVQSTLFDNQSYADFDARATRVAQLRPSDLQATALGWFRLAARLLLTAERRDEIDRVTDDVERAFSALGADLDREIALRVATAALPLLGLRLDRVRGEDFFQAGASYDPT